MDAVDRLELDIIEKYKRCIASTGEALEELRVYMCEHSFTLLQEEIDFFKVLKPKVQSLDLYYRDVFEITIQSTGNKAHDEALLQKQLQKIDCFYEENSFLLRYYRSGATYLDDKLFVRAPTDGSWLPSNPGCDASFTAVCDKFIATLSAYEKLNEFISKELKLLSPKVDSAAPTGIGKTMEWTDSKAAATELVYGLFLSGSLNNGQASIKEIADFVQRVFGIDLGNYYRIMQELRIRKSGPTNYIDRMKAALLQYMDETDLNYKQ